MGVSNIIKLYDKYISLYKTLYSYDIDISEEEFNKIKVRDFSLIFLNILNKFVIIIMNIGDYNVKKK